MQRRKGERKLCMLMNALAVCCCVFSSLFCTILFAIKLDFDSGHLSLSLCIGRGVRRARLTVLPREREREREVLLSIYTFVTSARRTMSNACLHASSHINAARDALKNTIFMDSTLSGAASRKFCNLCRAHSYASKGDECR
jgi:membrane glycosyltransferase